ncbi:methyltransferase type 11 [Ktedonobacter sp. SOSP1-52]|uniref:class I SAM-dependent methyltransferase n=1 Tax=Ktedonobacter sp. SOSP1-52 TaxID=2778366 RepID=UPI001915D226|nr:class I SAM-dependent methyltransferase [Ktedonobacter sp. SOSP1-52]GHO69062.1 methyltransferase type 11 [Ktedonobacter sp. SOSP1-52]
MNYFADADVARRYATFRPYFHPLVISKVQNALHLDTPVKKALDVACGTGQSTRALKHIADQVIGCDLSPEMLAAATELPGVSYILAPAEQLPFDGASIDLITISSAFHWVDRMRFLPEAARVLRSGGWLVIYDNSFEGSMRENQAFEQWVAQQYLTQYPVTPRENKPLDPHVLAEHGLRFIREERYVNEVLFTREDLVRYLMTKSLVISVLERGERSQEEVYLSLLEQVSPFFTSEHGTFRFSGYIWYIRKENTTRAADR